ncbi:Protein CLEC16A-like protein [Cucurbita argyrosperma subsp. argyrosperma]|nr:Protein CLEC16A-like protein [Cucurbita argyrosperma subsp. argyrosperma]
MWFSFWRSRDPFSLEELSQIEPMELVYIFVLCSKLLLRFIHGTNLAAKGMARLAYLISRFCFKILLNLLGHRYLTDQLLNIEIVDEVNEDFVIEALRSISELITYGDQHDASFFEFFMEKQIMGEFVRILQISRTATVSLQLLQTMSIIIQNLKSEHAIYYLFSTEHINKLITYAFDFRNDELLSYYMSFLRFVLNCLLFFSTK